MRIPIARCVLTVSVPVDVRELVAEVARAEGKTISATATQIFCEYHRQHQQKAVRASKKGGRA